MSLVLKRVAPALGISGTTYHVLDILLGLVQADDFQADRRPVVAISNQRLADYTHRTPRTVTRCLKTLVEAGILAYRDSPTGRRYVYRGRGGEPEQAYGLDFTPACHNHSEFKALADAFQARVKALQEAKRAVSRISRAIVDLVDAAGNGYQLFVDRAAFVIDKHKDAPAVAAELLQGLYDEAVDHFNLENQAKMSCAGDIDDALYTITTFPDSSICNDKWPSANADEHNPKTDNGFAVEMAPENEPCGADQGTQQHKEQAGKPNNPQSGLDGVSIGLLNSACPTAQTETGLSFSTWPELCEAADMLRMMIGLSQSGYTQAVQRQGRYLTAACLAVVAEKALRDPEQISNPAGYFRAMIERAVDGKLLLAKSLHGLAKKND
ncbi:plasmid replication protein RepC [Roseibium sp. RKSG952]|uniref:plasmid replication protein RepC n=1 Tax=Roseibium sp. RKSG952 TaxID=2529384 RepID=UPI0034CECCB2